MRKIFTMLFALVALCTTAQLSQSELSGRQVSRASLPARHFTLDPSRSINHIAIDYDSFDVKWQHQHTPPDSMYTYSWNINKNNLNTSNYSLRYAVQTYDTLIDVNNNFAGTAKAGTTARMDSFDLILAESNQSGLNDTFIVSVFDKSVATVTGTGVNSALNTTSLWADTIISNQHFLPTDSLFYVLTFKPNVTLPAGHVAGIRVDFKGDTLDQLYVLASYRDHCGSAGLGDTNKIAPRNSSFYWNYNGASSSFANWSTNLAFNVPNACKYFFIQNFLFYPYLTLNTGGVTSITATATKTNVNCFGASTGSATATPSGGTTYTYIWSNGGTSATISNLPAGSYSVTVTDAGGGTATASVSITQPASALSASASSTATTCGASAGSATVVPTGGTPNYSYNWSNGGTTATISNLGTGSLSVTVSDSKGCLATTTTTVTAPGGPSATSLSTNVSCFGSSTGGVTVTVTGGTGNITYSWSNTSSLQNLTNVPAGNYSLTITDANNCSFSLAASVSQPSAAISTSGTVTNATSGNNGAVNVTTTGGTASYSYSWSNSATTEDLTGLSAGVYTVTVTDQNSCTATATFTVTSNVGFNNLDLVSSFNVFPNPASAMVNVQMTLIENTDVRIELLDLNGKLILTENAGNVKQLNYQLNTSTVANGVYVLHVVGSKLNAKQQLTLAK